jgi:hypothetical protein
MPKKDDFNFMWKLTENYFNLLLVLVGSILVIYAIVYNNTLCIILAIFWGLIGPFIATFIDKKSNERSK